MNIIALFMAISLLVVLGPPVLKMFFAILNWIDDQQEQTSRLKRRDILNLNSASLMNARSIMNEKRLKSMEMDELRAKKIEAEIERINAQTAYYREARSKFGKNAADTLIEGATTMNQCPNGHYQSLSLGDTCQDCGESMSKFQPYVN